MRLAGTQPGMAPALGEHAACISQGDVSQVSTSVINVAQEKGRARSVL